MTTRTTSGIADRRRSIVALSRATSQRRGRPPLEVRNEAGDSSAAVYLYGVISPFAWGDTVSAKSVIKALADIGDVDNIDLHIHSPGGDSYEGVAILNAFRNHPATVTVHVDGIAASAASFIAMAGDEIVMGLGSQMMIHDAWMLTIGNAEELHEDADWLDKQSQNIAGIYAARAGGTADDWRALMKAETWYTAEEAVTAGLADRVSGESEDTDVDDAEIPEDEPDPMLEDLFDLSIFTYAGREHAPAPRLATAASHRPPAASAGGSTPTHEGSSAVPFTDEQITTMRQRLGVAEDADEATIMAALDEALDEQPTTTQVPDGMTLIETSVLDELRNGARLGTEARQRQLAEDRDRTIEAAIRAGKTTPARREHWQKAWDADPEGTRQTLDALAPGLVPVDEHGHDTGDGEGDPKASVTEDPKYKNWRL